MIEVLESLPKSCIETVNQWKKTFLHQWGGASLSIQTKVVNPSHEGRLEAIQAYREKETAMNSDIVESPRMDLEDQERLLTLVH